MDQPELISAVGMAIGAVLTGVARLVWSLRRRRD
jgi:hypothetical protein